MTGPGDAHASRAYRGAMARWLQVVVLAVLAGTVLPAVLAACSGDLARWRSVRLAVALVARVRRSRPHPVADVVPLRRPIEQVGADLRRLHTSFHRGGMRFAKYEGCRLAYDRVLAEAADMAGETHLLEVLGPGAELDHERDRVEVVLRRHGMLPPLAA
ncbi:hypothetical protein NOZE110980_08270 [Nocardioides zeicaulis]